MVFLGNTEFGCKLHPIDFAAFARACGGTGFTIEDPADCGRILDQALGHTLRWWLLGRGVSMLIVSLLTAAGLWLIGVPLALTFGLLAALLTFVPHLGPIVAAIPPTLLALTQQPQQALYVILLYFGIQGVASYLLTPLVPQRTVSLPPALTITAQALLRILLGASGVVLATPLVAAALVLIRMLYIEDVLGERHELFRQAKSMDCGRLWPEDSSRVLLVALGHSRECPRLRPAVPGDLPT